MLGSSCRIAVALAIKHFFKTQFMVDRIAEVGIPTIAIFSWKLGTRRKLGNLVNNIIFYLVGSGTWLKACGLWTTSQLYL